MAESRGKQHRRHWRVLNKQHAPPPAACTFLLARRVTVRQKSTWTHQNGNRYRLSGNLSSVFWGAGYRSPIEFPVAGLTFRQMRSFDSRDFHWKLVRLNLGNSQHPRFRRADKPSSSREPCAWKHLLAWRSTAGPSLWRQQRLLL